MTRTAHPKAMFTTSRPASPSTAAVILAIKWTVFHIPKMYRMRPRIIQSVRIPLLVMATGRTVSILGRRTRWEHSFAVALVRRCSASYPRLVGRVVRARIVWTRISSRLWRTVSGTRSNAIGAGKSGVYGNRPEA